MTRFIEGEVIPPEEMRRAEVRQAGATLRRLHDGPPIPGRFDSFRVVEAYRETAAEHGVRVPDDYGWAKEIAAPIEQARADEELVPATTTS